MTDKDEMVLDTSPRCDRCNIDLEPIHVVTSEGGNYREGFAFTREEPKVGALSRLLKNKCGTVHGALCPRCRRVYWHAELEQS